MNRRRSARATSSLWPFRGTASSFSSRIRPRAGQAAGRHVLRSGGWDGGPARSCLVNLSRLLDDVLAPYGARNLVLVDACRGIGGKNKGKGVEGRDVTLKGETAVLFSCSRGEKSFESKDIKHGLFTWAVLKGLRGEATKGDVITWSSLTLHVEEAMASDEFKKLLPAGDTQTPIPTRGQLGRTILLTPGGREREEEFEYVIDGEKKRGKRRVLTLDIGGGQKMEFVRIKGRIVPDGCAGRGEGGGRGREAPASGDDIA